MRRRSSIPIPRWRVVMVEGSMRITIIRWVPGIRRMWKWWRIIGVWKGLRWIGSGGRRAGSNSRYCHRRISISVIRRIFPGWGRMFKGLTISLTQWIHIRCHKWPHKWPSTTTWTSSGHHPTTTPKPIAWWTHGTPLLKSPTSNTSQQCNPSTPAYS